MGALRARPLNADRGFMTADIGGSILGDVADREVYRSFIWSHRACWPGLATLGYLLTPRIDPLVRSLTTKVDEMMAETK